jgi:hypothetical protein
MTHIRVTLPIASDMCKNVTPAVLFGSNGNSYTITMQSYMCTYTRIFHNIDTLVGQKKWEKIFTAVNATCQGYLSACSSENACHWFVSPTLNRFRLGTNRRNIAHIFSYLQPIQRSLGSWRFTLLLSNQTEADVSSKTTSTMADTTEKAQGLIRKPSIYVQGPLVTSI